LYTFSFLSLWFHGVITYFRQYYIYIKTVILNISYLNLPFLIIFIDLIQCFIITAFIRAPLILPWPKHHKAPILIFALPMCLLSFETYPAFSLITGCFPCANTAEICTISLFPITKPRVKIKMTRPVCRVGCILHHLAKKKGIEDRVHNSDIRGCGHA